MIILRRRWGIGTAFRLKRSHERRAPADSWTVERLSSRGMRKSAPRVDVCLKQVAPGTALRWLKHRVEEFRPRSSQELNAKPRAWTPVVDARTGGTVPLPARGHQGVKAGWDGLSP